MKDTWELCTVFETLSLSFQTKRLSNKFTVYSTPFSKLRRRSEEDKDSALGGLEFGPQWDEYAWIFSRTLS